MILRAGLTSVILVALLALGLAVKATGLLSPADFDQFAGLARGLEQRVAAITANVDRVVAAEPPKTVPGLTRVLLLAQGKVVGLDRWGNVTFCDTACACSDLPALTGLAIDVKTLGGRVSSPEMTLAFAILEAFESSPEVYKILSEIDLARLEEPKAILCGGVIAVLGQGGYADKVERLKRVLVHLGKLEMIPETIDLRFGRQVSVKCTEQRQGSRKEV